MSRIHPECPDSRPSDHSVAAEFREAPDEVEEEDENDDKEEDHDDDDDDTTDDGYSE